MTNRTAGMDAMIDPTITCPICKTEIKLTESLAAPLTRCVVESKVGMYGDMQGIAGKTLHVIDDLNINAIETESALLD